MVGEKLGSFLIDGTLGVGAMGVVYRATHEKTGRLAAVKVVIKEVAAKGNAYERFEREAKILQQFRHKNIVQFYAMGRYQGTSYIAMEFIAGNTLEQVLADRPALPWTEVADLAIQVCDALAYAHEHGVVHRDLKPSNMMLNEKGVLKLTDFGIAKDLDATALTATGRTLGTAAYMAPEQIRGDSDISHKTDLYQLGCVLYQFLTGRMPFDGTSAVAMMHGHLNGERPVPSHKFKDIPLALGSQLPDIPPAMDELVVRLMAKKAQDRPDNASLIADRLKEIREKLGRGEAVPKLWPYQRIFGSASPMPVVDAETSGVMVVAKTEQALATLSAAFAARDLDRVYQALCWGMPAPAAGDIEGAIGRDPRDRKRMALVRHGGKHALTHYKTLRVWHAAVTLLECRLSTGRTHQIRVHLSSKGHPIVGDPVYLRRMPAASRGLPEPTRTTLLDFPRQALHAARLGFAHPRTGAALSFETAPPADMLALIADLDRTT